MGSEEITYEEFFSLIRESDVEVDPGLSDSEFAHIETKYGFTFPPDLRKFLSMGIPVGDGWLNWRRKSEAEIRDSLGWPLEGMLFDIKNNVFWLKEWGRRPWFLHQRNNKARSAVSKAPKLIPIFSHRYIPDRPHEVGNPIFSVYQTDIIYYGHNLQSYLLNEFGGNIMTPPDEDTEEKYIEFWTEVMEQGI